MPVAGANHYNIENLIERLTNFPKYCRFADDKLAAARWPYKLNSVDAKLVAPNELLTSLLGLPHGGPEI